MLGKKVPDVTFRTRVRDESIEGLLLPRVFQSHPCEGQEKLFETAHGEKSPLLTLRCVVLSFFCVDYSAVDFECGKPCKHNPRTDQSIL